MKYKGIILAGGAGTRLYPASLPISKILLPIYDKPMIYYPLSTLISAGVKDILIITNKKDEANFKHVLGNGKALGINIEYKAQLTPRGVAEALIIAEDFIKNSPIVLILGDNIFYGKDFSKILKNAIQNNEYATIFGYYSEHPELFGVIEFDNKNNVVSLEEKPENPKSNYIATGLYIYNNEAINLVKQIKPSIRGELEITDLNNLYLKHYQLKSVLLDKDIFWQDTGSFDSLLNTAIFIKNEEKKLGRKIGCIEENAVKAGFLRYEDCIKKKQNNNSYYEYIFNLKEGGYV